MRKHSPRYQGENFKINLQVVDALVSICCVLMVHSRVKLLSVWLALSIERDRQEERSVIGSDRARMAPPDV